MTSQTFTFHGAPQATFEHCGKDKRGRGDIFRVETPHRSLELFISNEGRSCRVWDRVAKRELT